jgi:hypothetical protein
MYIPETILFTEPLGLVHGLMKFLGTLNTALNFVNPTANTTIQIPAKATQVFTH